MDREIAFGSLRGLLPRSRSSLFSVFAADRWLLWATVMLILAAWTPLGFT